MEEKIYAIADKKFTQDELVFGQEVWLRDYVFQGKAITALAQEELVAMLQTTAMTFLAIILIEDGTTQADKVMAGWQQADNLAAWLTAHVKPREVMEYVNDFFVHNRGANLWLLADAATLSGSNNGTGSPTPSSSLQTVT